MYFNESLMLELWKKGGIQEVDIKYKGRDTSRTVLVWNNKKLLSNSEEKVFWEQVKALVRGVINTHKYYYRFYRYLSYDEMISHGIESCHIALGKYNPDKILKSGKTPSLFNYLSLTAKQAIYFEFCRNYKTSQNTVHNLPLEKISQHSYTPQYTDLSSLDTTIQDLIKNKIHKNQAKFYHMNKIFIQYMREKSSPKRRAIHAYFREHCDYSPSSIRQFLKLLEDNKDRVYDSIEI